jgi:hypothetical protein
MPEAALAACPDAQVLTLEQLSSYFLEVSAAR